MVEIIKRGEIPENKWYHATCNNCETQFKFQKSEVTPRNRHQAQSIECPFCEKTVFMSSLKPYPPNGGLHWYDR